MLWLPRLPDTEGGDVVNCCHGRKNRTAPRTTVAAKDQVFQSFHHGRAGRGSASIVRRISGHRFGLSHSSCNSFATDEISVQRRYSRRQAAHSLRCSRASAINSGTASALSKSPHSNFMCVTPSAAASTFVSLQTASSARCPPGLEELRQFRNAAVLPPQTSKKPGEAAHSTGSTRAPGRF